MKEFITYGHSNLGRGSQLLSLSRLRPTFRANRTKRSNSTSNLSLTTCPQFHFVARPNVGRGKLAHLDLISDALPFGRLWYGDANAVANAVRYATHCSRSHDAVIRVYDAAGNVIETHEHAGEFKEW